MDRKISTRFFLLPVNHWKSQYTEVISGIDPHKEFSIASLILHVEAGETVYHKRLDLPPAVRKFLMQNNGSYFDLENVTTADMSDRGRCTVRMLGFLVDSGEKLDAEFDLTICALNEPDYLNQDAEPLPWRFPDAKAGE